MNRHNVYIGKAPTIEQRRPKMTYVHGLGDAQERVEDDYLPPAPKCCECGGETEYDGKDCGVIQWLCLDEDCEAVTEDEEDDEDDYWYSDY